MAIDLTKLEKKFIDLFANVTQEEFEQWLLSKTESKPMTQQTAVEWLVNHWKKLQSEGEKMSWQQIIDITELAKQIERQQRKDDITDYNIKVTEFLLNPLFNLEHSKHGIACEKLADIRNEFIKKL